MSKRGLILFLTLTISCLFFLECTGKRKIYTKRTIDYEVITKEKFIDSTHWYYKENKNICDSWSLSKTEIEYVLDKSIKLDSERKNLLYSFLPCMYKGKIVNHNNDTLGFEINAGAFSIIYTSKDYYYLGFEKEQRYFIDYPNNK